MTISNFHSYQISPFKISKLLKCVVLLATLLSLSVPSIADKKIIHVELLGSIIDFSYYQSFLVISLLWIALAKNRLSTGRIERVLIIIFFFIILFNMVSVIINDSHLLVISLRGIFNFGINVLSAFWIGYIIRKWLNVELLSLVFIIYGIIIALSGVAEFSFLKFSPNLLEKWRSIVWGAVIESDELLEAGGATLHPDGMARVGGFIGAPENLGVVIAFTLPFAILSRISLLSNIAIVSLYTLVAIIAGSRMLGVALAIYIIIVSQKFNGHFGLKFLNLFMISSIITGIIILGINNETYSRFTIDAFLYELLWRGEILTSFLEATKTNDLSPLIGAGLGQFERGGPYEEISRAYRGILGGDIVIAYGLGGIGGILVLWMLWVEICKMISKGINSFQYIKYAVKLFIIVIILKSMFMPVLMALVLMSNIITFMSIAGLISLSHIIRKQKAGEQDID